MNRSCAYIIQLIIKPADGYGRWMFFTTIKTTQKTLEKKEHQEVCLEENASGLIKGQEPFIFIYKIEQG